MVTKGYQEGVYERVTTGTGAVVAAAKALLDLKISDFALQISGYVPFPLKPTACGLLAASGVNCEFFLGSNAKSATESAWGERDAATICLLHGVLR